MNEVRNEEIGSGPSVQENGTQTNDEFGTAAQPDQEQEKNGSKTPAPRIGIDEEGNLFIQANLKIGYLAIRGFLDEAKNWLEETHPSSYRNKMRAAKKELRENKILRPDNKGFGLFNRFNKMLKK